MNFYNCTLQLHLDLLLPAQETGIQPLQPRLWHSIQGKKVVQNTLKIATATDHYISFIWYYTKEINVISKISPIIELLL